MMQQQRTGRLCKPTRRSTFLVCTLGANIFCGDPLGTFREQVELISHFRQSNNPRMQHGNNHRLRVAHRVADGRQGTLGSAQILSRGKCIEYCRIYVSTQQRAIEIPNPTLLPTLLALRVLLAHV
jgi:hypothetical protein